MNSDHPTALEQAARIRSGDESSEEAVRRTLSRIEATNPRLNAFVSVFRRRALASARARDRRGRRGDLPPFHGVPIGVKDLQAVRWSFTRMGSRSCRWLYTPMDDDMVRALRSAGFVVVGKLSTSELGLLPFVETDVHPPTRNPANDGHTAGGSSGGSAAAVASGMLPVAPGSDGGGSIRIPSAFCGLFGCKPTRGLLKGAPDFMDPNGMASLGPIARTVSDAAALFDVMLRREPASPGSFTSALETPPTRLRISLCVQPPAGDIDPEVCAGVRGIAASLRDLGHEVREVEPPAVSPSDFLPIYARLFASIPVIRDSKLQPITRWMRGKGRGYSKQDAADAHRRMAGPIERWLRDTDVLLTATTAVPAPAIGEFAGLDPEELWEAIHPIGVFTAGFNVNGNPAVSVPAGHTAAGLPIGAQLVGARQGDARLLSLARQLEVALGGFDPLEGGRHARGA